MMATNPVSESISPINVHSMPDTLGMLPVTGVELGFIVVAALLLIGSGLMLRKVGFSSKRG